MKNPLELTLLEIEALMHGDADAPQFEYTRLLRYIHTRQAEMYTYLVQREVIAVKAAHVPAKGRSNKVRDVRDAEDAKLSHSFDDLLDSTEIVVADISMDIGA